MDFALDAAPEAVAMTRAAVARRLGVAIASVRRMEARGDLHPEQTAGGVRLFDPQEVEQLAATRGAVTASPASSPTSEVTELRQRVEQLEGQLAALAADQQTVRQTVVTGFQQFATFIDRVRAQVPGV